MEYLNETDRLLQSIVDRDTALKPEKKKLHWTQARRKRQERDRRIRATPGQVRYRAKLERSLRRRWKERKRIWTSRGVEWGISFEDWCLAWILCPLVNGAPAWQHSGLGKDGVRVERIRDGGWSKHNFQIVHGKEVLFRFEEAASNTA